MNGPDPLRQANPRGKLAICILGALVFVAAVAYVLPPHRGSTDLASLPGAAVLTDAEMSAVLGGFNQPKGDHDECCECQGSSAAALRCNAGQDGGTGTHSPQVSPGTGNVRDSVAGPSVGAVGGGLSMNLDYRSDLADGTNAALALSLSYGWVHTHENSLMESGPNMTWIRGDGRISFFKRIGPIFRPMSGEFAALTQPAPGAYELRTTDGAVYRYDLSQSGQWPGVRHLLGSMTDSNGRLTTYTYDPQGRLTQVTDHFGNALTYQYDAQGRVATVVDPLGRQTRFAYDTGGNLARIDQPDGTVITYRYNARRQMTRKTIKDPCPPPPPQQEQPGTGNPLAGFPAGMAALGQFSDISGESPANQGPPPPPPCPTTEEYRLYYDPATARITSIRDMDGSLLYSATSSNNWAVDHAQSLTTGEMIYVPGTSTVTDGRGNVWTYTYDDRGLVTRVEAPLVDGLPAVTQYEYDSAALKPSKITDPLGRETRFEYDASGNTTRIIDAEGNETRMEYDHATIPSLRTARIEPDGDTWRWEYDANGNLLREIDPLHDSPADPTATPGPCPCTEYGYDGLGRMTQMSDRNGHSTTYMYDTQGRLSQRTRDPAGLDLVTQYEYDANGNRVQTIDPRGIVTEYEYDTRDRVIRETRDPGGLDLTTRYEYDGRDNRTKVTNPRGHATTYEYDTRNRMTRTTDPLSHVTTYTYDGNNNRTSTTDANGNVTTYEYDARNRLIRQVDDAGPSPEDLNITTRYTYDAADNRVRTTREMDPGDGPARVTEFQYDALDRMSRRIIDPDGMALTTEYHYAPPGGAGCGCAGTPGSNLVTCIIDGEGKVTRYEYDGLDRRTHEIRQNGTQDCDASADADDAVTVTTYDPVGNVTRVLTEADPSPDRIIEYQYDAADRRTQNTVDPSGANLITTYQYDGNGNVTTETRPNGNVITYSYDTADRLTTTTDTVEPLDPIIRYEYDANGNVLRRTDGNGNANATPHDYDADDRLTTEYDNLDRPTTYQYDSLNNVVRQTDRNGHVTIYEYDGVYRRTAETRAATGGTDTPLDIRVEFTYDDAGNQRTLRAHNQSQSGPEVQITEYQYDAANRRVREIYPDDEDARPRDRIFFYDAVGNVITRIDQQQNSTGYQYDDLHRLTQRRYRLGPASPSYPPVQLPDTYTYDRASQMLTAVHQYDAPEPNVALTFTYDGVGRVTSLTQDDRTVQYQYDINPATNRRDMTYPSGRIVREDYDDRDRLSRVSDQPADTLIADRAYDPADRLITQARGNSTSTAYQYDADNRTTRITHSNGGGPFVDLEYGHDAEGNPLYSRHHHALDTSERYFYDASDRLVDFKRGTLAPDNSDVTVFTPYPDQTQRQQWSLDHLGNWLINQVRRNGADECEERFANKANEYTSVEPGQPCPPPGGAPQGLSHDDNGNLSLDPTAGPGATGLRYEYDIENRLTRATRLSDNAVVGQYYYDALGRRVRKVVTNSGALDGTTQYLLNERWQTLAEYDDPSVLLREYTYGPYVDEPLTLDRNLDADASAIGPADQRLYYHANHLFSTYGLTDPAGDLVEAYRYDPYGRHTTLTDGPDADAVVNFSTDDIALIEGGSTFDNPVLFTGRVLDPERASHHYRTRDYHPLAGRFTTRDTIGMWGDPASPGNGYSYAASAPTRDIDPTGMDAWQPLGDNCAEVRFFAIHYWVSPFGAIFGAANAYDYFTWAEAYVAPWPGYDAVKAICWQVQGKDEECCKDCKYTGNILYTNPNRTGVIERTRIVPDEGDFLDPSVKGFKTHRVITGDCVFSSKYLPLTGFELSTRGALILKPVFIHVTSSCGGKKVSTQVHVYDK